MKKNPYHDDIIVVNQFDDLLTAAHDKVVPWKWFADELAGSAVLDGRGNALFCAGYTGQNSKDGTVLPGMNFASLNLTRGSSRAIGGTRIAKSRC